MSAQAEKNVVQQGVPTNAVPRMDFRNPKNLEAGKREAEATPKQQRDLYDVEKFEKVSATQMSVNPLESNKC